MSRGSLVSQFCYYVEYILYNYTGVGILYTILSDFGVYTVSRIYTILEDFGGVYTVFFRNFELHYMILLQNLAYIQYIRYFRFGVYNSFF